MTDGNGEQDDRNTISPDWKKVFVNRQEFLKVVGLSFSGIIGLVATIPAVAFMLNYLLVPKKIEWVNVGPSEKFKEGETVEVGFHDPNILPWDGVSAHRSAWLRRVSGDSFTVFATNCTHLGCPVRWEANADIFLCPCHGGVYYSNGDVAAGPPPKPLHQYPVRLVNGNVEIKVTPVLVES
jgi:menaquinol-cytochrome c reductase iron-sulfur subunit